MTSVVLGNDLGAKHKLSKGFAQTPALIMTSPSREDADIVFIYFCLLIKGLISYPRLALNFQQSFCLGLLGAECNTTPVNT